MKILAILLPIVLLSAIALALWGSGEDAVSVVPSL